MVRYVAYCLNAIVIIFIMLLIRLSETLSQRLSAKLREDMLHKTLIDTPSCTERWVQHLHVFFHQPMQFLLKHKLPLLILSWLGCGTHKLEEARGTLQTQ